MIFDVNWRILVGDFFTKVADFKSVKIAGFLSVITLKSCGSNESSRCLKFIFFAFLHKSHNLPVIEKVERTQRQHALTKHDFCDIVIS